MTLLGITLTLVGIAFGLSVLIGVVIRTLRDGRKVGWRRQLGQLDEARRSKVYITLLDIGLLLAVTPLFLVHAWNDGSIWDLAFQTPATTFGMTVVLLNRPALFAWLGLIRYATDRICGPFRIVFAIIAATLVITPSSTAISCTLLHPSTHTCATLPSSKYITIPTQILLANIATVTMLLTVTAAKNRSRQPQPIAAARAPSLSLLIHTQPEPWTRHIHLELHPELGPVQRSPHISTATGSPGECDFGPALYGPRIVTGVLGTAGSTEGGATSVGFASEAAASSTNPYHVESTGSRQALGGCAASGATRSRQTTSTGEQAVARSTSSRHVEPTPLGECAQQSHLTSTTRPENPSLQLLSPRTPSPWPSHDSQHAGSRTPSPWPTHDTQEFGRSATQDSLLRRSPTPCDGRGGRDAMFRADWVGLVTWVVSLWSPIVMSVAALMMRPGEGQRWILLGSFCLPALVVLLHELAGCMKRSRHSPDLPSTRQHHDTSTRASPSSSITIIPNPTPSLPTHSPHHRSHSSPLETTINGYTHLHPGGFAGKERSSLSSARSVPYLRHHWTAGKINGDRVAPRSSFVRGLNLVLNPRPRLEALPARCVQDERGRRRLSTGVAEAVVKSLLDTPRQEQMTSDSERDGASPDRQDEAEMLAARASAEQLDGIDAHSPHSSHSQEMAVDDPPDVVLHMDDSPGGARQDPHLPPLDENTDLQSPTKRRIPTTSPVDHPPTIPEANATTPPSFSQSPSHDSGSNSASRLFSEILDMVRGSAREVGHRGFDGLRRTPPKGYACIDGVREVGISRSDERTVIIHSTDPSDDFRTAASHPAGCVSSVSPSFATADVVDQGRAVDPNEADSRAGVEGVHLRRESGHVRTGSASSTLSLSSISSRIRAFGRSVTPSASPGDSPQIRKIRSRTFASAFGIELGRLSRNASQSSPSTCSRGCPSSLMDTPSPVQVRRAVCREGELATPSKVAVPDNSVERDSIHMHRRNQSRADSIPDMLDGEQEEEIEEMIEDEEGCAAQADFVEQGDAPIEMTELQGAYNHSNYLLTAHEEPLLDTEHLHEIDLGYVTVNDVWVRFPHPDDTLEEDDMPATSLGANADYLEEDMCNPMGGDPRRMVARAPFLDTVEEESEEGHLTGAGTRPDIDRQLELLPSFADRDGRDEANVAHQDAARGAEQCDVPKLVFDDPARNPPVSNPSPPSAIPSAQSAQRPTYELLLEHEAMFPHKTLSQIIEVTEATSTLRASGTRTSSESSSIQRSPMASMRLGLPLSLTCQQESGEDHSLSSANVVETENNEEQSQDKGGEIKLPFVTPRSRTRCRAAAVRKVEKPVEAESQKDSPLSNEQTECLPSPGSASVRLGQLGMDRGIWMRSPLRLELDESCSSAATHDAEGPSKDDGGFEAVDASTCSHGGGGKLRRSLTLTRSKMNSESRHTLRRLARKDHHASPKREYRSRLAKTSPVQRGCDILAGQSAVVSGNDSPGKRLPHKPIKKRRKSRLKGVAVMIARHEFTVVDEDDSLVQRFNGAQSQ